MGEEDILTSETTQARGCPPLMENVNPNVCSRHLSAGGLPSLCDLVLFSTSQASWLLPLTGMKGHSLQIVPPTDSVVMVHLQRVGSLAVRPLGKGSKRQQLLWVGGGSGSA